MDVERSLERGREAYAARAWRDARELLTSVNREAPLEAEDLELLARSAHMLGLDDEYASALERAHHAHLESGDVPRAVRCPFWIGRQGRAAEGLRLVDETMVAVRAGELSPIVAGIVYCNRVLPRRLRAAAGARVDGRLDTVVRAAAGDGGARRTALGALGGAHDASGTDVTQAVCATFGSAHRKK